MSSKRRTVSYPDDVAPDPWELLNQLRGCRDSPYWNRSLSAIGGMILLRAAQVEVDKYVGKSQGPRGGQDANGRS